MFDVRHFNYALYALIFLSSTGFAMAAEAPGLWLLTMGALSLHLWLYASGRFAPLPSIVATTATVLAFIYAASQIFPLGQQSALVVGQFLVILQVIKLYEQRGNRDLLQIIVLSLLLTTAAAINAATLIYSVLLLLYLLAALYTALLFHLKIESEAARERTALVDPNLSEGAVRRDRRLLSRSMRRLTGVITVLSMGIAVVVFILCPRGDISIASVPLQQPAQTLTGFSEQVSFQQVARITQNDEPVAHVKIYLNGQLVDKPRLLLFRGLTLDSYNADGTGRWEWTRSQRPQSRPLESDGQWLRMKEPASEGRQEWRQEFRLLPTGTRTLFALPGPTRMRWDDRGFLQYASDDETLRVRRAPRGQIEYEVVSDGEVRAWPANATRAAQQRALADVSHPRSVISPRVAAFARLPEVSGTTLGQPLHLQRPQDAVTHELDDQIASNIYGYLKNEFEYTLDLTDATIVGGEDPMEAFLYLNKRGHCEYFAGAMTMLCQELGLTARMVVGFLSDDYNPLTDSFIIRQSHAHAWVEVLLPDGRWKAFDPTAASESSSSQERSIGQQVRHLLDFFEQTWAVNVIGYDRGDQEELIEQVDTQLATTAVRSSTMAGKLGAWMERAGQWMASNVLGPVIVLMALVGLGAIGWYVYEQWQLRRRAERIGLEALPAHELKRLARQLGFYDELLRLLGKRQIRRPPHLTPMEFSQSLTFLPGEAYDAVRRLTQVFYRIRYGGAELSAGQQNRLRRVIGRVDARLS